MWLKSTHTHTPTHTRWIRQRIWSSKFKMYFSLCCVATLWSVSLFLIYHDTVFYIKHKTSSIAHRDESEQSLHTADVPSSEQGHNQHAVPPHNRFISTLPSGCCYRWIQREVKTFQPSFLPLQGVPEFICRFSGNEIVATKPHCWLLGGFKCGKSKWVPIQTRTLICLPV